MIQLNMIFLSIVFLFFLKLLLVCLVDIFRLYLEPKCFTQTSTAMETSVWTFLKTNGALPLPSLRFEIIIKIFFYYKIFDSSNQFWYTKKIWYIQITQTTKHFGLVGASLSVLSPYRPKSWWSSGSRYSSYIQNRQDQIWSHGSKLDPEVCLVLISQASSFFAKCLQLLFVCSYFVIIKVRSGILLVISGFHCLVEKLALYCYISVITIFIIKYF